MCIKVINNKVIEDMKKKNKGRYNEDMLFRDIFKMLKFKNNYFKNKNIYIRFNFKPLRGGYLEIRNDYFNGYVVFKCNTYEQGLRIKSKLMEFKI